jgi:excisionase family DNA binding protein
MVSRRIKMFCWKEIKLVPMEIDGQMYYRTSEACKKTGVSRATLFRWLKAGILEKCYKDRRGWRIFTEEDLKIIRGEARRIEVDYTYAGGKNDKHRNS